MKSSAQIFNILAFSKKFFAVLRESFVHFLFDAIETKNNFKLLLFIFNRLGVGWPVHLECDRFPSKSEVQLCFGPNKAPIRSRDPACVHDLKLTCPQHMAVSKDYDLGWFERKVF